MIDDSEIPRVGVFPLDRSNAQWRVWAPRVQRVELVLASGAELLRIPMDPEPRGFHAVATALPEPGHRYSYSLDGGPPLPDPCSRWQPEGIFKPSAVWLPDGLEWDEGGWSGIEQPDLVFYEIHIGTFTREATFESIIPRIPDLLDLGITAVELMPIGQFPGTRGWGYDGVHPFAPQNSYGGPSGLYRLVQQCHQQGMAVFLDVIYNHFGPEGNVFPTFGDYLNERIKTDWGSTINFDESGCDAVRAMVLENARSWIRDYHVDGLRLDAADRIYDRSPRHIVSEIVAAVHDEGRALGRKVHVFAETDMNDADRFLALPEQRGYGCDGQWNDDFHHAVHVTLTEERNGYYADFSPARDLAKVYEQVFANDGRYSVFRDRNHGAPAVQYPGDRFVAFVQNHDQVGNRMRGDRLSASLPPSALRLAAGLLLLAPRLPLLFMGEEYGETHPFPFFCDFESPELREAVRAGRKVEFAQFRWQGEPPDAVDPATRDAAVLSWCWKDPVRKGLRTLYRDLLRLRRQSPTLRDFRHGLTRFHGEAGIHDVLELVRGGVEPLANPELRIVFNLSAELRRVPTDLAAERPSFRSEVEAYGGQQKQDDRPNARLQPHEFVIYGALGTR